MQFNFEKGELSIENRDIMSMGRADMVVSADWRPLWLKWFTGTTSQEKTTPLNELFTYVHVYYITSPIFNVLVL